MQLSTQRLIFLHVFWRINLVITLSSKQHPTFYTLFYFGIHTFFNNNLHWCIHFTYHSDNEWAKIKSCFSAKKMIASANALLLQMKQLFFCYSVFYVRFCLFLQQNFACIVHLYVLRTKTIKMQLCTLNYINSVICSRKIKAK